MIIQKQADLGPAMKLALKNHVMRKRRQLKQELEQDAIEKRLKREQEAKRKQDAMTLDQLKDQLVQLNKTLDNLKSEKHSLFLQLKQNMRVLNDDDKQIKPKEEEPAPSPENKINNSDNVDKDTAVDEPLPPSENNTSEPNSLISARSQMKRPISSTSFNSETASANKKIHTQPTTQSPSPQAPVSMSHPYIYPGLQPPINSMAGPPPQANLLNQNLMRAPPQPNINPLFNHAAFSHLLEAQKFPRQHYISQLQQSNRPMSFGQHPMSPNPMNHLSSVQTSMSHVPRGNPMVRTPPLPHLQMPSNQNLLNSAGHKLTTLPMSISGPIEPIPTSLGSSANPMSRPLFTSNMPGDSLSSNKKINPQQNSQNISHQLSLSNPYLSYPGLSPSLNSVPGLPQQASLLNHPAFYHLYPQSFQRQAYFPQLAQMSHPSIPFGHHPGIPTTSPHAPQDISVMTRLPHTPQQMQGNSLQINNNLSNPPVSRSGPINFNSNLSNLEQIQQQAMNNAAAAAAFGLPFGSPYLGRFP